MNSTGLKYVAHNFLTRTVIKTNGMDHLSFSYIALAEADDFFITRSDCMNMERQCQQLQDEVNRLTLENVAMRRDMLIMMQNVSEDTRTDSDCQTCSVLKFQAKMLISELTELKSTQSVLPNSSSTELRAISGMLSKERERRLRLESIVSRQQSYINEISERGMLPMSPMKEVYKPEFEAESNFARHYQADYDLDDSGTQPWDMNIDDLNRQLLELSENVQRVELASNKLNSSFNYHTDRPKPSPGSFSS